MNIIWKFWRWKGIRKIAALVLFTVALVWFVCWLYMTLLEHKQPAYIFVAAAMAAITFYRRVVIPSIREHFGLWRGIPPG